jgi:hypothetical protein
MRGKPRALWLILGVVLLLECASSFHSYSVGTKVERLTESFASLTGANDNPDTTEKEFAFLVVKSPRFH